MSEAYLALETGDILPARGQVPGTTHGELVFTTAYTGYEESLTDPSYAAQVLTFAYPLIGNYGVRSERFESDQIQPTAMIAREVTDDVVDWLAAEDTPVIDNIDTRQLVTLIREHGAMKCGLAVGPDATPSQARAELEACPGMSELTEIGARVSPDTPYVYRSVTDPEATIALVDCGAKRSILTALTERDVEVHVYPYDATPDDVAACDPDLVFLSNGPGDPANFHAAQTVVKAFVGDIPIAGICLGQQIVAEALGGSTEKLPFGHRGVNQPVQDVRTDRVMMTTQNHGYAVADPGDLTVTQVNVNDETPEGLEHDDWQILTRQYHPEANPGPHDSRAGFFDTVVALATQDVDTVSDVVVREQT